MTGLLLISHGPFAKAALESSKVLLGDYGHVKAICFEVGESTNQLEADIQQAKQDLNADSYLVMVDVLGGTPFNVSSLQIAKDKCNVITGINMTALLEVLPLLETKSLEELSGIAVEAGKEGIVDVAQSLNKTDQTRKRGRRNVENR